MGCCFGKSSTSEAPPTAPPPPQNQQPLPPPPPPPPKPQPPPPPPTSPPKPQPSPPPPPKPQPQPPPPQPPLSPPKPQTPRTSPPKSQPSPPQPPLPPLDHCISLLQKVKNVCDVDDLIDAIEKLLETIKAKSKVDKSEKALERSIISETTGNDRTGSTSVWTFLRQGGAAFLELLNNHIQQSVNQGDFVPQPGGAREAVAEILQSVGKVHWLLGGLCIVGYLLEQIGQVSQNQSDCIQLLRQMLKLAGHLRHLNYDIPQEEKKFSDAIQLIVEGSMMCASQLNSKKLFRFFRASVDSRTLGDLQSRINQLYQDLTLTVVREIIHQLPTTPPSQPIYPEYAVGIDEQKNTVTQLLDLKEKSSFAVVIYGFGCIGKTTLAYAVVAKLDLKGYNYTGVHLYEDPLRNDYTGMQQKILKDAFPEYDYGRKLVFASSADGRTHLSNAFRCERNKPTFIFIDNALNAEDLQELLPKDLGNLPQGSRILVTTRNLSVTDMLQRAGIQRRQHHVKTVDREEAMKILFKDRAVIPGDMKDQVDNILRICDGIPLVLEIVGARLRKQGYRADKCTQIFEALEKGKDIKEEKLSQRLVTFIYDRLEESVQEAFLDICCFFTNWNRRHVEYIVGAEEVSLLEEAALVKASDKNQLIVSDIIRAKGLSILESSRTMDVQSFQEAVQYQNLKQIKRVLLVGDESKSVCELKEEHLNTMTASLRILALGDKIRVSGESPSPYKFKELRFLRIGCDVRCLPLNLELLERLALYHGPFFKDGVNMYQLPKKLRVIRATGQSDFNDTSPHSAATGLSQIPENSSLEELDLHECTELKTLPPSFMELSSLEVLNLESCWKLESLPSNFGQLRRLRKLSLQSIYLKELPSSFVELSSLAQLKCDCVELKELPSNFGQLQSLTSLDLSYCMKLKTLPPSVGQLSFLKDIKLLACFKLEELPSNIMELPCLNSIDLRRCRRLKNFPLSSVKETVTVRLPDHLEGKPQGSHSM